MSNEKENGVSNTRKSVDNGTDSSSKNNNGNGHMNVSPEALERYRKNKEFRENYIVQQSNKIPILS